jgi:hypothetical protein
VGEGVASVLVQYEQTQFSEKKGFE